MPERLPEFTGETGEAVKIPEPLFEGGWVSISQNALTALGIAGEDFRALLERHLLGDWGEVTEEEQMLNNLAVDHCELIRSIYRLSTGMEIYVTTEGDRESTIIELPDEAM
jgi:hypothetical protein